jgi:4-phytase/acid phosphatase/peptide/nickel transport system substrate-binding protein
MRKIQSDRLPQMWLRATVAASIVSLVTIAALALPAAASGPRYGGTLTFGTESEFAGFEVIQFSSRLAINGSIAANTVMEPLFRLDAQENLVPVLGLSAKASEGGKLWTVKLRRGVLFHDGTVFTADAVTAHWGRLLDPVNKFRGRSAMGPIVAVKKVDEFTVAFRLKHPWLPFRRMLGSARTLANLIPSPRAVEQGIQARTPVGTGPFRFKEWKSGDRFVVVKNPAYWQKSRPYLEKIVFKPLVDPQTRYASLQSGQVDVIWMDRGSIIKKADKDSTLTVHRSENNGAEIFIINTSRPPLDDINVRRALAYANNQALQVKMAYQNSIPVVHHPFGADFQCPDDGYPAYDPGKARKLNGKNGQPIRLELLHSSSKRGRDIGEITQQLFKDAGIQTRPVGLDFGPVVKKVISGDYQISTWRISSRPDQGPALVRALHSASRANFSRYKNPEMDKLLLAQRMETDPVNRQEILCRIARQINEDVPLLYRGGMRSHVIARNGVKGLTDMKNGIVHLTDVWVQP